MKRNRLLELIGTRCPQADANAKLIYNYLVRVHGSDTWRPVVRAQESQRVLVLFDQREAVAHKSRFEAPMQILAIDRGRIGQEKQK